LSFNADGSFDTTFGFQDSGARLVLGAGDVSASAVIDSAGRIVVSGVFQASNSANFSSGVTTRPSYAARCDRCPLAPASGRVNPAKGRG